MRDPDDIRAVKAARSAFSRRGIDVTMADIQVRHGVVQLRGTLQRMGGADFADLKSEVNLIAKSLKQKPEIRDVILDCTFRG